MESLKALNSYVGSGYSIVARGTGYTMRVVMDQFRKQNSVDCIASQDNSIKTELKSLPQDVLCVTKCWRNGIWFCSGFVVCLLLPNISIIFHRTCRAFWYIYNHRDEVPQFLQKLYRRSTQCLLQMLTNSSDNPRNSYSQAVASEKSGVLRSLVNQDLDLRRADVPENAPDSCPGVYSEQAGVDKGCDGCPNQRLCATGEARKPDPVVSEGLQQLNMIRHKILVLSGKGGVGKSTVASQLAWSLQKRRFYVGLLDVDICGPSIPRMTGTTGAEVHLSAAGWEPIYVEDNFGVMSIGFLLPEEDDAVVWRGPKKNAIIRQFLTDVTWGDLDFLVIDTPPGTSDEHLSIAAFLKETQIDGAVIVTTPQEVALQDVRKEINFCKKVNIPILGVIENMSGSFFEPNTGGAKYMAEFMGVKYSGSLPLDKSILTATENGLFVGDVDSHSRAGKTLQIILDDILSSMNEPETNVTDALTDEDELPPSSNPLILDAAHVV